MRRRYLIGPISTIIIIVCVFFSVKLLKPRDGKTATITDCYGVTYLAVLDQNQQVYAGVTGVDNKLYAARINENGEVELDDSVFPVEGYDGTLPSNNTTAVAIHQTQSSDDNYNYIANDVSKISSGNKEEKKTTEAQTTVSGDTNDVTDSNTQPATESTTENRQPQELLADKYRKLFASGNYYMSFTTNDPDLEGEIKTAFQNGNVYLDTTIEGIACSVIVKDGKGYVVIPKLRIYCLLPDDMVSEMTGNTIAVDDESEYISVETYDAKIGDRTCQCEEYTYENGKTKIYYFYNGELVRFDSIEDDLTDIYDINTITSSVDSSLFNLPRGYVKINLSWLESQLEEES